MLSRQYSLLNGYRGQYCNQIYLNQALGCFQKVNQIANQSNLQLLMTYLDFFMSISYHQIISTSNRIPQDPILPSLSWKQIIMTRLQAIRYRNIDLLAKIFNIRETLVTKICNKVVFHTKNESVFGLISDKIKGIRKKLKKKYSILKQMRSMRIPHDSINTGVTSLTQPIRQLTNQTCKLSKQVMIHREQLNLFIKYLQTISKYD